MNPYQNLPLVKENIDLKPQGKQDKRGLREVDIPYHGAKLRENFKTSHERYEESKKTGEDFIIRIIRHSDKSLQYTKLGLELLAEIDKTSSIVKVVDTNSFYKQLDAFTSEKVKRTRVVHETDFANMEEFVYVTPEEKMGALLLSATIQTSERYTLDIQLYVGNESLKELYAKVAECKTYLSELNIDVLDDFVLENLVMLKISLQGSQIEEVLEHNNVYHADLPQQSAFDYEGYKAKSISELPTVLAPPEDAPFICVVDSGVLPTHPLLTGAVYTSESFGNLASPFDENGHGTMVGGIALYGDVYSAVGKNEVEPSARLLNARVTNKDNEFPDDKIIAKVVGEAIEHFASEDYDCKIFNISLGDSRLPYQQGTKMDSWSYVHDTLNHKYNLAIVSSIGNYFPSNDPAVLTSYVGDLLSEPDAALIPPALAVTSLTVGSKAKTDVPYNHIKNRLGQVPIAQKEHISPFSRAGLGYNNSIKPEVIAYGGNFSFNQQTKRVNSNERNLGIFSTSIFGNGSWFETGSGTSFAAPYIAHLLSQIKREIPTAQGNLLRAMLINTTRFETEAAKHIASYFSTHQFKPTALIERQLRLQGYGEVREQHLTKSSDNYVTMYHEGEIGVGKVNVFEIYIPDEVYTSKQKTKLHISLAYNPPCKDTRIDYMGVRMSFALYAGLTLDEIKKYTCTPDDEDSFEKDKLPKDKEKHRCSLPFASQGKKGTLVRATHDVRKQGVQERYGNIYYLVVKCTKRWYEGDNKQPFAVVVSLENEDEGIELYAPIKQRIEQRLEDKQPARRIRQR